MNMLIAALRERGCLLRSDSRLCSRYILNGVGNADEIADTMCEMAFFFKHTPYRMMCCIVRRDMISEGRSRGLRWVNVDRDRVSELAKHECLVWWLAQFSNNVDDACCDIRLPDTLHAKLCQIAHVAP